MQEAVLRAFEVLRAWLVAYPEEAAAILRPVLLPVPAYPLPNRALKIAVDLGKGRNLQSLTEEIGLKGKKFLSLTFLSMGTGRFGMEICLNGTSFFVLAKELYDGYRYYGEFDEIKFDNIPQTGVEPPVLLLEWRE